MAISVGVAPQAKGAAAPNATARRPMRRVMHRFAALTLRTLTFVTAKEAAQHVAFRRERALRD